MENRARSPELRGGDWDGVRNLLSLQLWEAGAGVALGACEMGLRPEPGWSQDPGWLHWPGSPTPPPIPRLLPLPSLPPVPLAGPCHHPRLPRPLPKLKVCGLWLLDLSGQSSFQGQASGWREQPAKGFESGLCV